MRDKFYQIADIMGQLCHDILWADKNHEILNITPELIFTTRVGSGLATYCRYDRKLNVCTITFGRKMILSKYKNHEIHDWLTSREIIRFKYFDGEVNLLNVLTHTICHEFSHLIQQINGQTYKRSIHNKHFYSILGGFYSDHLAYTLRAALEQRCHKVQISLDSACSPMPQAVLNIFQKNDRISFVHGNKTRYGIVEKINRKTVTVLTTDRLFRRQLWRVPFSQLTRTGHNEE